MTTGPFQKLEPVHREVYRPSGFEASHPVTSSNSQLSFLEASSSAAGPLRNPAPNFS